MRLPIALYVLAASAGVQSPPAAPVPEIVVTAQQRKMLSDFVATLSTTTKTDQIARWKILCPIVVGVEDAQAALILERIEAVARTVKLDIDDHRCQPSTLIVFSNDPDAVVAYFVKHYPITLRTTA